jgi:acyl CoA:acetate/3-ketoacid CoA transferase beta subunit
VKRVYTDIAVVEVRVEGFVAIEIISSISAEDLRARTGAPITIADGCRPLVAPVIEG